jgi:class 3 adenylate cyclase/tetratricopeptide (TPR) repeat protein
MSDMVEAQPAAAARQYPPHEERRLQAIMFTDMFGYSRMMGEDEARTIRLVEEHRQIVRAILPLHAGREHQTIGDAFVVLFDSALNAVSCAVAIQKRLRERNAALPEGEQIWIRIGIHLDDIVLRDGHIYGDGVNLAARVEPLAEKGGICVTEPVLRHVEGKVAFGFVSLGEQALKNIARPPALYAVHVEGAPRPKPTAKAKAKPARTPLIAAALVVAVIVVGAMALRLSRPLAVSEDPVAAAKLAEGLRRQVDMDIVGMNAALLAAIDRDDGLAAAHLRLAAWAFDETPLLAREHFLAANRHRDRLDAHDRALLEALSAYVGTSVDVDALVERTRAGLERFGSPEHRFWAARALALSGRHAEAVAVAEAGDVAGFLPLAWVAGESSLQLGREAAGVAHLQRCVEQGPSSTRCLLALGLLQLRTGRCDEMERTARVWAARAPADGNADDLLAWSLAARGEAVPSIVEALKRSQRKRPEALRPVSVAMDKTRLASWLGAFDEAEQSAREWLAELGTHPDVAMQVTPHSYIVAILLEQGRLAEADQAAAAFLGRAPAFDQDAFGEDWTMLFENVRAVAGAIAAADLEARRVTWLQAQRRRRPDPRLLVQHWRDAWGEWARTPAQAAAARAAWDRLVAEGLTVPPPAVLQPGLALAIGQMHLHTGDAKAALPLLEHAATSCAGLLEPLRTTRAWLALGQARAALGDVARARAAFQVVLDRWGDASHSVTADAARAGLAALPP